MTERQTDTALILVDVQNDFCPGGKLAVKDGHKVVDPLNKLVEEGRERSWLIIAGRDWHPEDTTHFAKDAPNGAGWPVHCVQETEGAAFHPHLDTEGTVIISKGMDPENPDSYSEFQGQTDDGKTLEELLREYQVKRVFIGGLATDYCVKATAVDAAKLGFDTYVMADAIRAVDLNSGDGYLAVAEMAGSGVKFTTTNEAIKKL